MQNPIKKDRETGKAFGQKKLIYKNVSIQKLLKQDVARYVVLRIPPSFICKSHGKQEVDVR